MSVFSRNSTGIPASTSGITRRPSGEVGPNVILLHGGIPGSSGVAGWRFMAPFLGAHGFRVFCPDQPGFGLSDPRQEYWPINGIYSHVQFLRDFADALCLDEFFLGGNSMGCIVSLHFVVAHPERVTAFAVIAGGIGDHDQALRLLGYLAELRREPATAVTPVIVLTARAQASDRAAMKLAGADHFLTKPFSPIGLASLVDDVLAHG